MHFYPRPPRGRATGWARGYAACGRIFYPRPPRGGRHRAKCTRGQAISYFYPRPPRGGRRRDKAFAGAEWCISIHALREEGDAERSTPRPTRTKFLSTPSARRATGCGGLLADGHGISIHALREEGDAGPARLIDLFGYFYPRPPRGATRRQNAQNFAS